MNWVEKGEAMRKVAVIMMVVFASVVFVVSALAESATKEECVAKCKEAAQLITEKGMDAAFQELQKKDGKFVWKDSYVYVLDLRGHILLTRCARIVLERTCSKRSSLMEDFRQRNHRDCQDQGRGMD